MSHFWFVIRWLHILAMAFFLVDHTEECPRAPAVHGLEPLFIRLLGCWILPPTSSVSG